MAELNSEVLQIFIVKREPMVQECTARSINYSKYIPILLELFFLLSTAVVQKGNHIENIMMSVHRGGEGIKYMAAVSVAAICLMQCVALDGLCVSVFERCLCAAVSGIPPYILKNAGGKRVTKESAQCTYANYEFFSSSLE